MGPRDGMQSATEFKRNVLVQSGIFLSPQPKSWIKEFSFIERKLGLFFFNILQEISPCMHET